MVDTTFFKNKGPFTLEQIAQITGAKLKDETKKDVKIFDMAELDAAKDGEISSFYDRKFQDKAAHMRATACIVSEDVENMIPADVIALVAEDPKLAILKLKYALYDEYVPEVKISASAKIASTAKIGQNCTIGENVVIEDDVVIGDNCRIGHNVVICRACQIGNDCRIESNATISYCKMGNSCYLYAGCRIGQDGFGFMFVEGRHKKIPQLGLVIIGNDVEIGANTCIDRGALGDTVIGDGCRYDNLVQIGHGVHVGRGCVSASQTGIAGSTTLGDFVINGGQCGFADHINIGSGARFGGRTGVFQDVEPGATMLGTPAMPAKDFMKQCAFIRKMLKGSKK